jgi:hypothetical protein
MLHKQKNRVKKKIDVALNMKPKQAIGHGNNGRLTTGNFSLETWQMGASDRMPDYKNHRYIKDNLQAVGEPGPIVRKKERKKRNRKAKIL